MRRLLIVALAAAAIAVAVWLELPPQTVTLRDDTIPEPVRGAIHVHTRRSDGSGTVEQIAAAAARAGLRFVVLTDHGDGRRPPSGPEYLYGVLCIDAVEISTTGGHVLALGLPGRAPFRLGGEPRDVVDDIARLGGFSIAAHPDSFKSSLRWEDWRTSFDGIEWLNADSEWRDESRSALVRGLFTYPFRKVETMTALLDRPSRAIQEWDTLTAQRPVVALAAADAHASMAIGRWSNPYGDRSPLAIPGYEQLFRVFSIALPRVTLTGDAYADASAVVGEIRQGHVYSSIDALARPGRLAFSAKSGGTTAGTGDRLTPSGPVTFTVTTTAPPGALVRLLRNGAQVASGTERTLRHETRETSGAYRVEVTLPGSPGEPPVPWLMSNPIYVGAFEPHREDRPSHAGESTPKYTDGGLGPEWAIEKTPLADGLFDVVPTLSGTEIMWRYALAGGEREGPYVALIMRTTPDIAPYEGLTFSARANRPGRMWVQVRAHTETGAGEWRRSVYLDDTMRKAVIRFDDMHSMSGHGPLRGYRAGIESILFVVDDTHTPIGTAGQIWIDDVAYVR